MSRNKTVLLIILIAALYFVTPNDGVFATVKANFVTLLPYIGIGIVIYLIITINVLKKAWKRLDAHISDDNVIKFAKIMNISFDVKRMLGPTNLIDLYTKVNFSKKRFHARQGAPVSGNEAQKARRSASGQGDRYR